MSVIVCGQQGCGKTKYAEVMMKHFGLTSCVDDWSPGEEIPENALVLTNVPCEGAVVFSQVAGDLGFEV